MQRLGDPAVLYESATCAQPDDRLTKKAEEQAAKISGEFCGWLRDLPAGFDDTVNTLPDSHIRALFATGGGNTVNPQKSKVAEGLKSWAKFGAQVTGTRKSGVDYISAITREHVRTFMYEMTSLLE